eukprot:CAMPEP_0116156804 /NCGR_PEP_ID=MMETSP0329-20121206/23019_1 /TAXON_ID=697910 /ORGANISM="Pseudo-nitzschia arenysensis, Strain B593" /LENGTH=2263 /DNA_ID=CAMNT_0003653895 /DNA_START=211 /DNA_END=7002 /DNA_ORIENTATION=-
MVKSTESSYRNRFVAENLSSFEKNSGGGGQKSSTDEGPRFSGNTAVYEPQSPEDLRQMKGSMSVSQASATSRKNDQWNVKRDIPVGSVRNNPFLPEPKQQPPQSPQLKYQKKQWDTSNIPKGSVAARIQKSNSPSNKTGGNKPISPTKAMGGSNIRSKTFPNSPTGYGHSHSKEAIRSTTSTPRGFFPKTAIASSQTKQKAYVKRPEETATYPKVKEKVATTRGWEPSREIPDGTVKGRLSSFYGGQSTLKGKKLHEPAVPSSTSPKNTDKSSDEVSTGKDQNTNDDEDQWIIPENKGENIQVFSSDWGEAIAAKSAESEDWDTPAKEWIRSGESQTDGMSFNEINERVVQNKSSLPAEISATIPDEKNPKIDSPKSREGSKPTILPPPPKDASAYHKPRSPKPEEAMTFDNKSDASFSQLFSDNFGSFATKSEIDSIDDSKVNDGFPVRDDIDQQLVNGASDAFGFPVSSTPDVGESRTIGVVVSGDEFFDASVLPDNYGRSSNEKPSSLTSAPLDDYAQPRGDQGYSQQTKDATFDVSKPLSKGTQQSKVKEGFDASRMPTDYDGPTEVEKDPRPSVLVPSSYEESASKKLASNLDRYPSLSDTSVDDVADGNTNEFEVGKADSKKKKKGFLKGLFGRKSKGVGKVKQSAKDNKKHRSRKERSYSKTGISDSATNSSEPSFPTLSNGRGHDDTLFKQKGQKLENPLPSSTVNDPAHSNQTTALIRTEIANDDPSLEVNQQLNERRTPKGDNRGSTIISHIHNDKEIKSGLPSKTNVLQEHMEPKTSSLGEPKAKVTGDDVFDDLEEEPSVSHEASSKNGDVYLDPELDHLDSNVDSDEDSGEDTPGPIETNSDSEPGRLTPKIGKIHSHTAEPAKHSKTTTGSSPRSRFSNIYETQQKGNSSDKKQDSISVSRKTVSMSRPNTFVPRQHSLVSGGDSSFGNKSLPMRYKKSSVFNRCSNVNDADAVSSRTGHGSQYGRQSMETKKFSRASHAYNSITKKTTTDDVYDQRKYLSIPAASTSASDISCSSTYDSYQKKLADSLKKANIVAKQSPGYLSNQNKSLDDSSIESDIRVLRSILRRPRLDRDNAQVIHASRQIQGFPTYDTESATDPMQRLGMRLLSSAIIPIQTEVRRFLAMRQALTRMWALIVIQAHARRFLARKKFHRAIDSAITIQSVVRGHLARNEVIDKHICAIEIQRHVRGYLATMQVYEDIYKVTLVQSLVRMRIAMDYAAYRMSLIIQLQAIARGFLTRRRNARLHSCATKIQSGWRCFHNRLNYQFDLLDIIIVQSLWRKKLGVRIAERKVAEKRNIAATIIQAGWRAYDCRMDFLCYTAARTIQTKWRSHICKMNYIEYKASATIQSAARMFICRLQYIDYQAAMAIQSIARMYFCRTDYTYYKCAKKIQSVARMSLCRSQYVEYKSASKIQSIARMYLCRYDYLEYKAAAKLQSAVRMFLCRSGYVEYQSATKIQSIGRMYLCRYDYLEYKAATTLQSAVRMFLCRSDYNKYRAEIAATIIQAKWRSYDCSSMYKRYRAARTIQKAWRSYDCQMNFLHFLGDILIVQSTIRRFLVQRRVKAMKNHAAVVIQTAWRGHYSYNAYKRHTASVKIQSAWRGLISYIDYHEHLTVRRIQSAWRGYVCRRDYKREKAAILIQSTWRGFLFYADYMFDLSDIVVVQKQIRVWLAKRVATRRRNEHRNDAATKIQKHWRRVVDENRYEVTKREHRASKIIQTSWRRFWCFSNFVIALDCSIQIQAQMRGYLQRKDYMSKKHAVSVIETAWLNAQAKKLTSQMSVIREITESSRELAARESRAAIKLQQVFRGSLCRNALKVYLAAVLIQSHVRGKQARVAVGLYIAVRKIQAAWRGFVPRQSYMTYIAARKIQATWRGYFPRQNFMTFIAARRIQNSWRCKKANQDVLFLRREMNAAISIQSAWRGFVSYTDYVFTLSDIVAAQKIARGYLSRKKYSGIIKSNVYARNVESDAAVTIQMIFRGFQARQNYWYTLGCTMQIQSWWRGRRVYRRIQKEAKAISTLQCFARCCLARQEYMQRRFVFMLIQTAELERSKKAKGLKMKKQRYEDMEQDGREHAANVFSVVDHQQANQVVNATKRRKEWRKKMKKEKHSEDVEETLLEDVWTGLIGKNDIVDEPFTRHYDDFSKLTGPAIMIASHPTSSIRMIRKVDAVDMDDDFQLEEAFIDAEICHAKERRQYDGKEGHPSFSKSLRKERRISSAVGKQKKRSQSTGRDKNKSTKGKANVLATINH